jgi:hypothetical protein
MWHHLVLTTHTTTHNHINNPTQTTKTYKRRFIITMSSFVSWHTLADVIDTCRNQFLTILGVTQTWKAGITGHFPQVS